MKPGDRFRVLKEASSASTVSIVQYPNFIDLVCPAVTLWRIGCCVAVDSEFTGLNLTKTNRFSKARKWNDIPRTH
jgi:hypothetical protein